MITLSESNLTFLQDKDESINSVVINGYRITAHKLYASKGITSIHSVPLREPKDRSTWLDVNHCKVLEAVAALEQALGELKE